jgi:SOS-response transcriptional repressor LexA
MTEIDPNTLEVYRFIRDYLEEEKRSPSIREIGDGCFVGHTTILTHLARLEGMGWIEREMNMARSIRLGEYAPDDDE